MSRTYLRLDERPEPPPEVKRKTFDDRKKYYSHYPSMRHESELRVLSIICIIISLLALVSVIVFLLAYFGHISMNWSFLGENDVRKWIEDNFKIICIIIMILSALLTVSAAVAAVSCHEQERYRRGLAAYAIMIISSVWTIIIPIISVIMMIRYIRARGSFFN